MFKNFINDESGATAIEYGIIVSTMGAAYGRSHGCCRLVVGIFLRLGFHYNG